MPGPDNIYVLCISLERGARAGLAITAGLMTGILVHTTIVAMGVSAVLFAVDWTYDLLKYLGAVYFLFLAYGAVREPVNVPQLRTNDAPKEMTLHLWRRGILMNVLNPKVSVFFLSLLPGFVAHHAGAWDPIYQLLCLGLIFLTAALLVFGSIAAFAAHFRSLFQARVFWQVTHWTKIVLFCLLAIALIFSDFGPADGASIPSLTSF